MTYILQYNQLIIFLMSLICQSIASSFLVFETFADSAIFAKNQPTVTTWNLFPSLFSISYG